MQLYYRCRNNNLMPYAGGLRDQDPDLLYAFSLIGSAIAEKREAMRKSQERMNANH